MTENEKKVRDHLRMLYQDEGPEGSVESTEDISEMFGIPLLELYDHNQDTGILFNLMQGGYVDRMRGDKPGEWEWQASGCNVEFNWH